MRVKKHAVTRTATDMASRSKKCRTAPAAANITRRGLPGSTQTAVVKMATKRDLSGESLFVFNSVLAPD